MKRVNIEEKTRLLNEFRVASVGKTFTTEDLREKLISLGFTRTVAANIMQHCFPFEKMGKSRLYEVPKEPIYKGFIATAYHKRGSNKKSSISEEEALNFLNSRGYQIRRCVGFDLDRFKAEQPVMYQKYLKYERI